MKGRKKKRKKERTKIKNQKGQKIKKKILFYFFLMKRLFVFSLFKERKNERKVFSYIKRSKVTT